MFIKKEKRKRRRSPHFAAWKWSKPCFLYTFSRAFGDKSGPPSLPEAEIEGQGVNGEECEVDEEEEEEVEKCVEEEKQMPGNAVTDQACSGIEELNLAEQEEEKGEKASEEEEGNQDDQKGIISHHIC